MMAISGMKGLAITQIVISAFVLIYCIGFIIWTSPARQNACTGPVEGDTPRSFMFTHVYCDEYYMLYVPWGAGAFISGALFMLAGGLGLAATTSTNSNVQSGMTVAHMVMCIVNTAIFAPVIILLGLAQYVYAFSWSPDRQYVDTVKVLGIIMALLGFVQFVISIISASYTCCCSPQVNTEQENEQEYREKED